MLADTDTHLSPINPNAHQGLGYLQYNARESSPLGSNRMFSRSASLRLHSSFSKNPESARMFCRRKTRCMPCFEFRQSPS